MNKNQLKRIIRDKAILSKFIDTTYPDKHFIKVSHVNALIDAELSDDVKNSSDHQRHAFIRKLKTHTETAKAIKNTVHHPDLYVDAYAIELLSTCVVARIDHMKLINALIDDQRIDIVYHN